MPFTSQVTSADWPWSSLATRLQVPWSLSRKDLSILEEVLAWIRKHLCSFFLQNGPRPSWKWLQTAF